MKNLVTRLRIAARLYGPGLLALSLLGAASQHSAFFGEARFVLLGGALASLLGFGLAATSTEAWASTRWPRLVARGAVPPRARSAPPLARVCAGAEAALAAIDASPNRPALRPLEGALARILAAAERREGQHQRLGRALAQRACPAATTPEARALLGTEAAAAAEAARARMERARARCEAELSAMAASLQGLCDRIVATDAQSDGCEAGVAALLEGLHRRARAFEGACSALEAGGEKR